MAFAVIGAGYGDEGKGATVHALARPDSIVVRFNGGAQAGHTVIHAGHRRVFSHFGSGTLKGASTHLSRFFVCHPLAFMAEWYDLAANGIAARVSVSPECPVTTIFDVAINRVSEEMRAAGRHGSVGVGFGETLERCSRPEWKATVGDLLNRDIPAWLLSVRDGWVPRRCSELGIPPSSLPGWLHDEFTIEHMSTSVSDFLERVDVRDDGFLMDDLSRVIFEGAQGLMLDQDHGEFPHVTRSNTGLKNVRQLADGAPLDVYYVTRAYTTRHGAGPLPHELPGVPYPGVRDDTNVWNAYQHRPRYSYLNLDTIRAAVRRDSGIAASDSRCYSVTTCLDQLPERARVIDEGEVHDEAAADLPAIVADACGCDSRSV